MNGWPIMALLLTLGLGGCATLFSTPAQEARQLAHSHGFHPWQGEGGGFLLSGFLRTTPDSSDLLVVYIEGDGFAWMNRNTLSSDPTPHNPVALKMAVVDSAPNVLYLARPCQYEGRTSAACDPRYWSSHRYAEEVVAATDAVVSQALLESGLQRVALVGYSGGGVIAALLAARRKDLAWWMSVAANLDVAAWTHHHTVTPMPDSLNPADFTQHLVHTRQMHLSGVEDEEVPPSILQSYRLHFPKPDAITARLVPGFDHHCCWYEAWPRLLAETASWRHLP